MRFYSRRKKMPVINIVSLIDVMTLLLIFFVVTTTFKKDQPRVKIDLPESSTAEKGSKTNEPIIIHVSKDEKISIEKEENIKLDDLKKVLAARKAAAQGRAFALEADKGVPLGFFVKILDASKEAGIENLSLYTQENQNNPQTPASEPSL